MRLKARQTHIGAAVGTLNYLAPTEQMHRHDHQVSPATDVIRFGRADAHPADGFSAISVSQYC